MKYLFICVTEFQLLSALNIKYHLLQHDDADIIIRNNHKEDDDILNRLRRTGLFDNVFMFRLEKEGVHQYIRNKIYHKEGVGLKKSLRNNIEILKDSMMKYIGGEKHILSSSIEGGRDLTKIEYDAVFFQTLDEVIEPLLKDIKKRNIKCKWNLLDEGSMSYLCTSVGEFVFDKIYIYEPQLSVCSNDIDRFVKIPKIDRQDDEFINLINRFFVHDVSEEKIDNAIVFFDQGYQAMPPYLKNPGIIKKIIFANPYKKHLRLAKLYDLEVSWFKKIIGWIDEKKYIKFHPRTWFSMKDEFIDTDVEVIPNNTIPWEVICSNCYVKNTIFITINSSSVCLYEAVIGQEKDNNFYILLDRLVQTNDGLEDGMFERLLKVYPQKLFIPNTEEELRSILKSCLLKISE